MVSKNRVDSRRRGRTREENCSSRKPRSSRTLATKDERHAATHMESRERGLARVRNASIAHGARRLPTVRARLASGASVSASNVLIARGANVARAASRAVVRAARVVDLAIAATSRHRGTPLIRLAVAALATAESAHGDRSAENTIGPITASLAVRWPARALLPGTNGVHRERHSVGGRIKDAEA